MAVLTFSSFLKVITKFAKKKQMTFLVKGLLEDPIKKADIRDRSHKQYRLTPKMCGSLYKGNEDVYPLLRAGMTRYFNGHDKDGSISMLLLNRIVTNSLQNRYIFKELNELVQSDEEIDIAKRRYVNGLYNANKGNEDKLFFREVFMLAIVANNKTNPVAKKANRSLGDNNLTTNDIIDILNSREHPVAIVTPDDIKDEELNYVKELLKVYSEAAHVIFVKKSDLVSDTACLDDFNKQRGYYYAAESIRVGLRDTETYGYHFFDELKSEIFTGLEDTCNKSYASGKEKMNAIMERVTFIPLNSVLMHLPGWIKTQERKGITHMLVNDEKIKWVEEKLDE